MWPKTRLFKRYMMGVLGGAMVFQVGCLSEQSMEAFITSGITTTMQILVNSVFFTIDSILVSAS